MTIASTAKENHPFEFSAGTGREYSIVWCTRVVLRSTRDRKNIFSYSTREISFIFWCISLMLQFTLMFCSIKNATSIFCPRSPPSLFFIPLLGIQ